MSFAGDLEHLPIVDVIQLLHSTKKTGTLFLTSPKGESQLTFNEGYIVSANHVHNSVRIGNILVEMGVISTEQLNQILERQLRDGPARRPFVATLIEEGLIDRKTAYAGLEKLIELTIVEILTWNCGSFALDVEKAFMSDEYRYFPETLKQDLVLNTQSVLMDALRIYDEKMRDGTLQQGAFAEPQATTETETTGAITADILGLDSLDNLDKKVPDVFLGLKEYDAAEIHRQKLRETKQPLSQPEHDRLLRLLMEYSDTSGPGREPLPLAVIAITGDPFMEHLISNICKHEGIFVFSTNDPINLDLIIDQSFSKELTPMLVIDAPKENDGYGSKSDILGLLQQKREKYPYIHILQLAAPGDAEFPVQAIQAGAQTILTRPASGEQPDIFVESTIKFVRSFHDNLQKNVTSNEQQILTHFKESIHKLEKLQKIQDVAFVVLGFAASMFERTLTFVVGENELIAEKGFGISTDKSAGPTSPLLFNISLERPSVFQDVINSGDYYYGQCNDSVVCEHLHARIGTPHSPKLMLMPIKTFGKTIALIYGDFGRMAGSPLQIDLLDIVARHAGLVYENSLYRKKLYSTSHQKQTPDAN